MFKVKLEVKVFKCDLLTGFCILSKDVDDRSGTCVLYDFSFSCISAPQLCRITVSWALLQDKRFLLCGLPLHHTLAPVTTQPAIGGSFPLQSATPAAWILLNGSTRPYSTLEHRRFLYETLLDGLLIFR